MCVCVRATVCMCACIKNNKTYIYRGYYGTRRFVAVKKRTPEVSPSYFNRAARNVRDNYTRRVAARVNDKRAVNYHGTAATAVAYACPTDE